MDILNEFQKEIVKECLERKSGGLSLPMGSGKTIISIILTRLQTKDPFLIICSKSLLHSWVFEIDKFKLGPYEIIDSDWNHKVSDVKMYLTTPDLLMKYYKLNNLSDEFVYEEPNTVYDRDEFALLENRFRTVYRTAYKNVKIPLLKNLNGPNYIYSIKWGSVIIDEVQKYTNIETKKCRSIATICSNYKWGLSGTIIEEPKIEKLLGLFILLGIDKCPRNLPEMYEFVHNRNFKGLKYYIVHRDRNISFTEPVINKVVINHEISEQEIQLYLMMKKIIKKIRDKVKEFQYKHDMINQRKFSSYLLSMITYLRQSIVCSLIVISNITLDIYDIENRSELSKLINDELKELNLNDWLNDLESVNSSRIKKVIETCNNHENDGLVLFTSYRTSIDLLKYYLNKNNDKLKNMNKSIRNIYTLESSMSAKKRQDVINEFRSDKTGILLLTYDLGSEGLNLQCSNTVLIIDFWWNVTKTQQAISRILRYGQESPVVNIYFFTSNTGIENALLKKHQEKIVVIDELMSGTQKSVVSNMTMNDILRLLDQKENVKYINDIYTRKKS